MPVLYKPFLVSCLKGITNLTGQDNDELNAKEIARGDYYALGKL